MSPFHDAQDYWDDDWDEDHAEWMHAALEIPEPFATMFGADRLRRYDLIARVEKALDMPHGREFSPMTERFVQHLCDKVVQHWDLVGADPTLQVARKLVDAAVWHMAEPWMIEALIRDFGWDAKIRLDGVTVNDYDARFRAAFASKVSGRMLNLLGRLVKAQRGRTSAA